ncbi:caspase family protein [Bradyrhizobium sp.]|uniref:caspase family protein n=1 Tax=Bradyrhizobium sp. TaxID=376 RepID=UPI0039E5304F
MLALILAGLTAASSPAAFAATALQKQSGGQCLQAPTNELRVTACSTFLSTNPPAEPKASALFVRAIAYHRMGKLDLAMADIQQSIVLTKNPQARSASLNSRGNIKASQGDFSGAVEDFNLALAAGSNDRTAPLRNRADAYQRSGQFELARKDHDEIIRIRLAEGDKIRIADAYNSRAVALLAMDEMELARADLAKVIELNPKSANAYINLALIYRQQGQYAEAIQSYTTAIQFDSKNATAYAGRGETNRLKGDLDSAIVDFNRAIEINPGASLALVYRADARRYIGEIDRAIADYNAALAARPDFPLAFVGRGLAYEKQGNVAQARQDFEKVTGLNPYQYDTGPGALRTARARLAALDSGSPQPVIPPAPKKAVNQYSIPTPDVAAKPAPPPPAPPKAVQAEKPRTNASPERRIALVIGNSAYRNVTALANPQKDAEGIANSLRRVGFNDVVLAVDLSREKLLEALRSFADRAEKSDWAMVYYAGHGIEVNGQNYLIPVDARLAADRDVQFEAIPTDQVMAALEGARKLRLIVLDACRDNPFAPQMRKTSVPIVEASGRSASGDRTSTRSIGRGLGEVRVSGASLVVFAAKHGQVALDGEGGNSPFAVAMIQRITTPGIEINKLFRLVRDDVMEATAGRQEPYTYGSLSGEDLYFAAAN